MFVEIPTALTTFYPLILDRNERTIGQSARTLEKNFYVEKQEVKEGKNRSKKIIVPTFKGICYGLGEIAQLEFLDCLKAYGDENEQNHNIRTTAKNKRL